MSTSSSDEQDLASLKKTSPNKPASAAQPFRVSSVEARTMSEFAHSNDLLLLLRLRLRISSLNRARFKWTMTRSSDALLLQTLNSSTPEQSSAPSPKRPSLAKDILEQGARPYRVSFHREVAKLVARHGIDSSHFNPTFSELIAALEIDPKQFTKKRGKLKDARAAELRFADGITWRMVFVVDEEERHVKILAAAPHDVAYSDAERRI